MPYVWHAVPKGGIKGHMIVPRNSLDEVSPGLMEWHLKKYTGRSGVASSHIPPLECGMGDVVNLSPISPRLIRNGLRMVGYKSVLRLKYFQFELSALDVSCATVWMNTGNEASDMNQYQLLTTEALMRCSKLPFRTIRYYRTVYVDHSKQWPLLMAYVPHVFYKGALDTRLAKIIEF